MAKRSEEEKKLLNEVLPNVAAQMRAPLSVLHAGLQKLLQEDAPGAAQLNQSYYQLLRLAGNLSAAELLDGEPYLSERSNGDIVALCSDLSSRLTLLAKEEGIRFSFVCTQKSHVILYDKRLIERLVLNLVSNAIKFTPAGGTVTLTVQIQERDVLLSVADTGCCKSNLASYKSFSPPFRFVVEKNTRATEHIVCFSILLHNPKAIELCNCVWRVRVKRSILILWNFFHLAVKLRRGSLINPASLFKSARSHSFQHSEYTRSINIGSKLRRIERDLHMTLCSKIINLVRTHRSDNLNERHRVSHISKMEVEIRFAFQMCNSLTVIDR